jgi:hypothetical protein
MKQVIAIEPLAPMSAVNVEADILDTIDDKILIQNWKGHFVQLTPSAKKDERIIYKVEHESNDLSSFSLAWFNHE